MSDYNKISNKLKELREEKNYTLEFIAEKLDVNKSTILRWENGETAKIKLPIIEAIAKIFNVSPAWLLGYDVPKYEKNQKSNAIRIPVLGTIPAGIPIEAIEEIEDYEEISADLFKGNHEYFAIKVRGNSMYPKYLSGDTLIVLKQNDCESGDDCIVFVNGNDATFKKIIKNEYGITLQPINIEKYEPKFYTNKEIENLPIRILGVVKEIRRKI